VKMRLASVNSSLAALHARRCCPDIELATLLSAGLQTIEVIRP
jgi:hypothetical protein